MGWTEPVNANPVERINGGKGHGIAIYEEQEYFRPSQPDGSWGDPISTTVFTAYDDKGRHIAFDLTLDKCLDKLRKDWRIL